MTSVELPVRGDLEAMLAGTPYVSYAYAYPHKTAYRSLEPPVPLRDAWADESRDAAFLYLHVPFCEYRCGFCNLFTQTNPEDDVPSRYLDQLRVEAERARDAIGEIRFAQLAIGGGTPTYLDVDGLQRLFAVVEEVMGAEPRMIPVSCESSPATLDPEKLALLREWGVDRLSIGVQTFDDRESGGLGRPQKRAEVDRALAMIADVGFPTLNIDLVYGGEGQSVNGFVGSVRGALEHRPGELYLYPLYVRPLTGLGRRDREWDDHRLEAYRAGRDLLLAEGYEQVSLRMFRRLHTAPASQDAGQATNTAYHCQEDGMVGLGCGARSYTRELHYSSEYAVAQRGVRAILADYLGREPAAFDAARHGIRLSLDDQRRRYVIVSLLQCDGLVRADYEHRFGGDAFEHLPQLAELEPLGLAEVTPNRIVLTAAGLERSDTIGPWLYSVDVKRRSEEYECR